MKTVIKSVIEFADNIYGAYLADIDGFMGIGDTIEAAKTSLEENIALTLEGLREYGFEIPEELKGEYEIEYSYDVTVESQEKEE